VLEGKCTWLQSYNCMDLDLGSYLPMQVCVCKFDSRDGAVHVKV